MKPAAETPRQLKAHQKKRAYKQAQRRAAEIKGGGARRGLYGPIPAIELFQREDCPFSHAVRNRLTKLGLDFVAHNVPRGNALKHEQLVHAGGKDQVPFLIDHSSGIKLYGSPAIISYLEASYGPLSSTIMEKIAKGIEARIRGRADQIAWTLRIPVDQAQSFRYRLEGAIQTVRGSLGFLRERVRSASSEGKRAPRGKATPESRSQRPRSIRPNVASMTEAA